MIFPFGVSDAPYAASPPGRAVDTSFVTKPYASRQRDDVSHESQVSVDRTRLEEGFSVDAAHANDGSGTERPVKLVERARRVPRRRDAHEFSRVRDER